MPVRNEREQPKRILTETKRLEEAKTILTNFEARQRNSALFTTAIEDQTGLSPEVYWSNKPHDKIDRRNPQVQITNEGRIFAIQYNLTDHAQTLFVERLKPGGDHDILMREEDVFVAVKQPLMTTSEQEATIFYRSHQLANYRQELLANDLVTLEKTKTFLKKAGLTQ